MAKKKTTTTKTSQLPIREYIIGEKIYLISKDRKRRIVNIMLDDEVVFSANTPGRSYSQWLKAQKKHDLKK